MLCLTVEFLTGRYRATDYRKREHAEWPPHPSRLFSALVDAAASLDCRWGPDVQSALSWLESLPPPCLQAATAESIGHRDVLETFVPVNDDATVNVDRARRPRYFPVAWPPDPFVRFLWRDAPGFAAHQTALERIASRVTYLGHSSSLTHVAIDTSPCIPNWFPDDTGSEVLRVPAKGRFESLQHAFQLGRRPSPGPTQRYREGAVTATIDSKGPQSAWGEWLILRKVEGRDLGVEHSLLVAERLRAALMSCAAQPPPACLTGHGDSPHVACLALPFVGFDHSDGHIMGCAVLLPSRLAREERVAVLVAVEKLHRNGKLKVTSQNIWTIEKSSPDERSRTLDSTTWIRPSRTWASVTPVLLDRFPKNKPGRTLPEIVTESCRRAGLPAPTRIEAGKHSSLVGVPPAPAFHVQRNELPPKMACHLRLIFDRPIAGPILLGAGRYFGLGLFRQETEEGARHE